MKIISGGQTGADLAALRAAKRVGHATGGLAPRWLVIQFDLSAQFGVSPMPVERGIRSRAQMLALRSMRNVDAADVTVAFLLETGVGTARTIVYARTRKWADSRMHHEAASEEPPTDYKPVLVITDLDEAADAVRAFLVKHRPATVNVCGSRSRAHEQRIEAVLVDALQSCVFK